jgi:very-short-patch-repair endonuclease
VVRDRAAKRCVEAVRQGAAPGDRRGALIGSGRRVSRGGCVWIRARGAANLGAMSSPSDVSNLGGSKLPAVAAIAGLAARQHGLVTIGQLLAAGFTRRLVHVRVRVGWLHRVHRGVYAVGHPPVTREAHWMAAVLACGTGALLSHRSAAALWGVRNSAASLIDVLAPGRRGHRRDGIRVHGARSLEPADRDEVNAIPVTALPRTIIDLGDTVSHTALEYAIHRAEGRRILDLDVLRDRLARMPANHRGAARIRRIIGAPLHQLDAQTRSRWERRFLRICRDHGIPAPEVNRWIPLPIAAGGLEVDFCWPRSRLVVEVDEERTHRTRRARRNDPARDRALVAAGWRPIRFPEAELEDAADVAAAVTAALAAERRPSVSSGA